MQEYEPPQSDLSVSNGGKFKPVKAIILGLLMVIVVSNIASVLLFVGFGLIEGIDLTDDAAITRLSRHNVFLAIDFVASVIIFYVSGQIVASNTRGKEYKFAILLALITLGIYLPVFIVSDALESYSFLYNLLVLISIPAAILFGARSVAKRADY